MRTRIYAARLGKQIESLESTFADLQHKLANMKAEYLSEAPSRERDRVFAEREAEIGREFVEIGREPNYPQGEVRK